MLAETLRQDLQHPPRIRLVGETDDEVIRVTDQEGPATQARLYLLLKPLVQHVVQVGCPAGRPRSRRPSVRPRRRPRPCACAGTPAAATADRGGGSGS